MARSYITHTHTYNCVSESLRVAFNAQLKQNGFRLTRRNHRGDASASPSCEIPPKSQNSDSADGAEKKIGIGSIVSAEASSSSIKDKLQQTSTISSSRVSPPAPIHPPQTWRFWKCLHGDVTLEIGATISLSRKLLLNLELNNWSRVPQPPQIKARVMF